MPSTPTHINLSTLIERPDSGKIDSGNQRRLTKLYTSTRSVVEAALKIKGTIGTGDLAGYLIETIKPGGSADYTNKG